jgi:hypothetical protein
LSAHVAAQPAGAWADHRSPGTEGNLELLAGLEDEAAFVRETQRLRCTPIMAGDIRLWLAATEWRALEPVKNLILQSANREVATARAQELARVEAPEAALPMLEILLGTKGQRVAAHWLTAHPLHAAVGLLPVASGHGALAQAAREQLLALKRRGHAPALAAARAHLDAAQGAWLQREILEVDEDVREELRLEQLPQGLCASFKAVNAGRLPRWVVPDALPPIGVHGGRLAIPEIKRVLTALATPPVGARSGPGAALLALIRTHADASSLDRFAWSLFQQWQCAGGEAQDKWAMWGIAALGGNGCVSQLVPLLHLWPSEEQHQLAVFGLRCLSQIGSEQALLALNDIAQRARSKGLRKRAQQLREEAAKTRGLTG